MQISFKKIDDYIAQIATLVARLPQFARVETDPQIAPPIPPTKTQSLFMGIRVVSSVAIILAGLGFIFGQIYEYRANFPFKEYSRPEVFNLTKSAVKWDLFFGQSPDCGGMECYITSEYKSNEPAKKISLPTLTLNGYKPGDLIYVRTAIQLPPKLKYSKETIKFQSLYIWAKTYEFYLNGKLIETGSTEYMNISLPEEIIRTSDTLTIALKIDPGTFQFQGLAHRGDIVIGPKSILNDLQHSTKLEEANYFLWTMLPQLAVCMVFCLMFLVFPWQSEFFYFIMFAFSSTLEPFFLSMYPEKLFHSGIDFYGFADIPRIASIAFLCLFIRNFFSLKGRMSKIFVRSVATLCVLVPLASITLPSLPHVMDMQTGFKFLIQFICLLFGMYASLYALIRWRKSSDQKARMRINVFFFLVFFLAFIPAFSDLSFFISEFFGIGNQKVYVIPLSRLAQFIFFFVFSAITSVEFGLTQSVKNHLQSKLESIELRLELARSVQQLLLPPHLSKQVSDFSYRFFYEPAEKMSGDWMHVWEFTTGETRLFIGDVVGKGPQAALAVSAIMSILSICRRNCVTMEETLAAINHHLLDLFRGKVSTTLSAVSLFPESNQVTLYNCGSIGWMVIDETHDLKYLPVRGSSLGTQNSLTITPKSIELAPGSILVTFSDGVLEGSRAIKSLATDIKAADDNDFLDDQEIHRIVTSAGKNHVLEDDKTLMIVRRNQAKALQRPA